MSSFGLHIILNTVAQLFLYEPIALFSKKPWLCEFSEETDMLLTFETMACGLYSAMNMMSFHSKWNVVGKSFWMRGLIYS